MPLYSESGYGYGKYGIADNGPIYALPISYYLNLLTSEYRMAPNLNANLASSLQLFEDVMTCNVGMIEAFDLDYATGVQLDILGSIAGVPRTVSFQPSGGVSPILDDDTYRFVIKATIANNQWQGTQDELYIIWEKLFSSGTIVILDNQNMTCTITLTGVFSSIIKDLIVNGYIIPRPEAVEYIFVFGTRPFFGYDENNAFIAGYDTGHWS
jgi:hypothetical protein